MASALQELRRAAGYRNADDFAKEMDIVPSTYKRYEQMPNKIPTATAWKLADKLNTSIDVIVGREANTGNTSLDKLFDQLSDENKQLLNDFIDFIVERQEAENKRIEEEEHREYDQIARNFENLFLNSFDDDLDAKGMFLMGSQAAVREKFEQFATKEYNSIRDKEERDFLKETFEEYATDPYYRENGMEDFGIEPNDPDFHEKLEAFRSETVKKMFDLNRGTRKEVIKKIMDAYDRAHPKITSKDGLAEYALMRLSDQK